MRLCLVLIKLLLINNSCAFTSKGKFALHFSAFKKDEKSFEDSGLFRSLSLVPNHLTTAAQDLTILEGSALLRIFWRKGDLLLAHFPKYIPGLKYSKAARQWNKQKTETNNAIMIIHERSNHAIKAERMINVENNSHIMRYTLTWRLCPKTICAPKTAHDDWPIASRRFQFASNLRRALKRSNLIYRKKLHCYLLYYKFL